MKRSSFVLGVSALLIGSAFLGCGQLNGVVGGECADGYTACSGQCIDLTSDSNHCGRCDVSCPTSAVCVSGVCRGSTDGSNDLTLTDGNFSDGGPDSTGFDGSEFLLDVRSDSNEASLIDSSTDSSSIDSGSDAVVEVDSCAPPYNTPDHCGDCFTKCVAPNDGCVASGNTFVCAPLCTPPKKNCFGVCVDTDSDPQNCGACGTACLSNLCVGGKCQGEDRGDIVYIGHDYSGSPVDLRVAQPRLLANSVLLTTNNPIRILSYRRYASATAASRIASILQATQQQSGRTILLTETTNDGDVSVGLNASAYDVFLVLDQETAPANSLGSLGTFWAPTLSAFTKAGGIFITLDGVSGSNPQMHEFETATGLLTVSSHTALSSSPPVAIALTAPFDAVGKSVLNPFGTWPRSARFATEPAGLTVAYVTTEQISGQPNVVHKIAPN